jgi:multidrug efflux pump subunit AcrA (membrane-fusion protein)
VLSAQLRLDNQKEELKQLLKMYSDDDKTEETEEIILKRTRNYVDQAEFALKSAKISAEWALNTSIPRKLKSMQRATEDARIANTGAKEKLPRDLELKRLEVGKAERDDKKSTENLTKLMADRTMMNITAPTDGVVYYGSMDNGRWIPAAADKVLKLGGKLTPNITLMTFIPDTSELELSAYAAEASLPTMTPGANGFAVTSQNRYRNIPVSLSKIATHPATDGTYRATLKATLGENDKIVPGMKATVKIIGQKLDKALTVPTVYLKQELDGTHTVKVKLADGKTEKRKVTIGASNKNTAVITQGLDKGQVIVK